MIMVPDSGVRRLLGYIFNDDFPMNKDLTIKLFTNNIVPSVNDVVANYVEASGGGYAAKTLTNGNWTIALGTDPPDAVYEQLVWVFSGPLSGNQSVYGYYVVDADNNLIFSERRASPATPSDPGDEIRVTINFQMSYGVPT